MGVSSKDPVPSGKQANVATPPAAGGCCDEPAQTATTGMTPPSAERRGCCETAPDVEGRETAVENVLTTAFYNALEVCFDQIRTEPKRILHIGGTRQAALARYMAFLLPAAEITVLDTDAAETERAREAIRCRFKFVTAPIEALPFEDNHFDLTLGHNLFQYVQDWPRAMDEIGRLTTGNLLMTVHRPVLWKMFGRIPGMAQALAESGVTFPQALPERNDMLTPLLRYGKIVTDIAPFPWHMWMLAMRPLREERLILH